MAAMTDDHSVPQVPTSDEAWQAIEDRLDEIAQLARSGVSVRDFHAGMLKCLVQTLAALGAAIWARGGAGPLQLASQYQLHETLMSVDEAGQEQHVRLLESILQSGQTCSLTPHTGTGEVRNPTSLLLLLGPLAVGGKVIGVVEVFQRPEGRSELLQGYLRILTVACELASDFHRDRELQSLSDHDRFGQDLLAFHQRVHDSLDLQVVSTVIANEGRRLFACDRTTVAVRHGAGYQIAAISGVDKVQRRAGLIRRLEALVRVSVAGKEDVWYPDEDAPRAPQLDAALNDYLDVSHAKFVAVVPLRVAAPQAPSETQPSGVLVVESFSHAQAGDLRARVAEVASAAATAIRNAEAYSSLPGVSLLRAVQGAGWYLRVQRLPRTLTVAALLVVGLLILIFVPTDFSIVARGELRPSRRCDVFAPSDGVVNSVVKREGDAIQAGDLLLVLANPKLDLEISDVVGRKRTTEEQLAAVRAARFSVDRPEAGAPDRYELTAQEEQLKEQLVGLDAQYQILNQQRQQLEVRSPTRGQILTWDVERLLAARPVQRGERLLTAADLEGPWEVELRIDDDQVGHVLKAVRDSGTPLDVSYVLATDPGERFSGHLRDLASSTDVDEAGRVKVWAVVEIADANLPQRQPGATVIAKIHCGRRAVGYVWFRPLIEAIQARWPF